MSTILTPEKWSALPVGTSPLSGNEIIAAVQDGISVQLAAHDIGDNSAGYLLTTLNSNLRNGRKLTAGANIAFVDGGPDGDFTISATGGGGGSPGGSDKAIQFNNSGSFGGSAMTWDSVTSTFTNPGALIFSGEQSSLLDDIHNNFALNNGVYTLYGTAGSAGGGSNLTGMTGGTNGRQVVIYCVNTDGKTILLTNLDSGSDANNQFMCPGQVNFNIGNRSSATVQYDSSVNKWRVISSSLDQANFPTITGNNNWSGFNFFNGNLTGITAGFELSGRINPAALAAGVTDDYAPSGIDTCTHVNITPDASGSILTGIQLSSANDNVIWIHNVGSGGLTLNNQGGSSAAANRFICPGGQNIIVSGGSSIQLMYSTFYSRWRVIQLDSIAGSIYGTHDFQGIITFSGAVSTFDDFSVTAAIYLTGSSSPAALAAGDTNDYSPAGLGAKTVFRLTPDATGSALTGLQNTSAGAVIVLMNISTVAALTLKHQNGGSSAANRFYCPGAANLVIPAGGAVQLWRDNSSSFWRVAAVSDAAGTNSLLLDVPAQSISFSQPGNGNGVALVNTSTDPTAVTEWSVGNLSHALHMQIASTAYASTLLAGGPTGQQAAIFTDNSAVPLSIGANSTAQLLLTSTSVTLTGGTATAGGHSVTVQGGPAGATGAGGNLFLTGGASTDGNSGLISMTTPTPGSGGSPRNSGSILLQSGDGVDGGTQGNVSINSGSGATAAQVFLDTGGIQLNVGGSQVIELGTSGNIKFDNTTTGAQTATFTATNKPGSGTSAVLSWVPVLTATGVQGYMPIFGA